MPRQAVQSTEVYVYKDDGVWWAEIQDSYVKTTRSTFTNDSALFILYVEEMLEAVELTLSDIEFIPSDDTAKKFVAKAQREAQKQ